MHLGKARLVDDLIPVILETDDHWWPRDFQRLALVSSAWVGPVRRRLYARPILRSFRAWIELRPVVDRMTGPSLLTETEMDSLRYILALGGLQSLTLGGELAVEAERFLHALIETRTITELHIDGSPSSPSDCSPCSNQKVASLEWDEVMAFKFPKLLRLTLTNLELTVLQPEFPYPTRLTHLLLDSVDIVSGLLQDISHASWNTLRHLSVVTKSGTDTDEHVRSMVECCINLESLHYETHNAFSHPSIFDEELSPCPSLRTLHISGFDINPQTLMTVGQLCIGIEHFSVLGRIVRLTPEDWIAFIASGALPSLQRLITPCGTNHPPFSYWSKDKEQASSPHPGTSSCQAQRKPTKKSSFLSLRREPKSPSAEPELSSPTSGRSRVGDKSTSPSSFHAFHDAFRPVISRPTELKSGGHSRRSSKSITSFQENGPSRTARGKEHEQPEGGLAGSARKEMWDDVSFGDTLYNYPIRDSNSSTLSQFEDPPQTPIDELSFPSPAFTLPVVVAAPIAGVETMDALVDGMNHYGSDDHFMGMGGMAGRSKFLQYGFHPLYQPPLPTPPPGITLGGALPRRSSSKSCTSDEDDEEQRPFPTYSSRSPQRRNHRPPLSRAASNITVTDISPKAASSDTYNGQKQTYVPPIKTVAPSISEIIRAHAPPSQQVRSRPTSSVQSHGHSVVHEVPEDKDFQPVGDEGDFVSRSSVDTIAEEINQSIRIQNRTSVISHTVQRTRSFQQPSVATSDHFPQFSSPRSEGRRESSLYSYSTISDQPPLPPLDLMGLTRTPVNSPSQTIAQYLRSARLTTLLHLTRSPHASRGSPLTVSLSDLGSPSGFPLVVFLGLGCVRHIMGLYDEMAECLGIRLITIDRWGLGRTDTARSKSAKGIPEWASVVEEVLDQLHINQCSVMAHSAGAPYALAFANRFPERIRGDVCLLAPWVAGGEGGGYKWLKYVPNGLLKTAQAAEWKVQAWMLGKPPTIAFEGIGFDVKATSTPSRFSSSPASTPTNESSKQVSGNVEDEPRQSMESGVFSEYDDLRDFEGRFESRSTLGRESCSSQRKRTTSESKPKNGTSTTKRKPSRSFLGRLKGASGGSQPQSPQDKSPSTGTGKKLKALRSMGSLQGKSRANGAKLSDPSPAPGFPLPELRHRFGSR
ncbi:hypothetical protein A0H81_00608 [Grifola frondosa]|uniref:AB hydrolase-1 domain-containing protein n=1 Tax=Grifola frondosa TaxID=5627 RepID=A0A1C7MQS9_GRIFR|nr:hypothetical protein A0H81_00608 [Grifola frondosa]